MNADVCFLCERRFTKQSKPRWAFDADLKTRGRVHTGCAPLNFNWNETTNLENEEEARLAIFCYRHPQQYNSPEWRACTLILAPAHQQEFIEWWTVKGPLHMTPEYLKTVLEAKEKLLAEFEKEKP